MHLRLDPIPGKLTLSYSAHARREQCRDKNGFIEHTPKQFILVGCKTAKWDQTDPTMIKVKYIYSDKYDLTLVICAVDGIVITNYLVPARNTGVFKGRFRLVQPTKAKLR